jgi:hypothetical protein
MGAARGGDLRPPAGRRTEIENARAFLEEMEFAVELDQRCEETLRPFAVFTRTLSPPRPEGFPLFEWPSFFVMPAPVRPAAARAAARE